MTQIGPTPFAIEKNTTNSTPLNHRIIRARGKAELRRLLNELETKDKEIGDE